MKVLEFKKKKEPPKSTSYNEWQEPQHLYPEKIKVALRKYGSNQGNVKKYNKEGDK